MAVLLLFLIINDSAFYKVYYRNSKIIVENDVSKDLKLLIRNEYNREELDSLQLNYPNNEWLLEHEEYWLCQLLILDLNSKKATKFYEIFQTDFGDKDNWFLGYSYFKNEKLCYFSNCKFLEKEIKIKIFSYSVDNNKLSLFKEFSIPQVPPIGYSISTIIFKVSAKSEVYITDNHSIYKVDINNKVEKLTTVMYPEIVYLW